MAPGLLLSFALGVGPAMPACPPQQVDSREEVVPAVDPYTRGTQEAIDRAGYVSFGPFAWSTGVRTENIEEALGEKRILWVETAHFKLGSTLATYRMPGDRREKTKLRLELERLAKKLGRLDPETKRLEPWLRLHLFAQRLEDQYGEFMRCFGITDDDFGSAGKAGAPGRSWMGSGPYLGMEMKPTVLLTERNSTLCRFLRCYRLPEDGCNWRGRLEGGTMFLGQSADCIREYGYDLDSALHCAVASDLGFNLVDGFRDNHFSSPFWFKAGLSSWFSRRVDERWPIYTRGTTLTFDDDSWKWPRRVRGLVANDLAIPWSRTFDWTSWEEIDAAGHMVLWSRVDWMLARKDADLHAFLVDMTEPRVPASVQDRRQVMRDRQEQSLRVGFGGSSAELDAEWKKFVLKSTPKD